MKEIVGYCGITCSECTAYLATQNNDDNARRKVAEDWSKRFKITLKPEDINCDGCIVIGKRQLGYSSICEIRKCGAGKKILNCGYCEAYPCQRIKNFHTNAPQAKAKLESIRRKRTVNQ